MVSQPADEGLPSLPVAAGSDVPYYDGPAILSLRPEQVRLRKARSAVSEPSLAGLLEKVLFAGSDTKYLVRIGHDRLWEVKLTSAAPAAFSVGEPVFLHWSLSDGRLFFERQ